MQGIGVRLAHISAGRMRLKVDDIKGNARRARDIEDQLRVVSGIHSVEGNPVTGSLLLTYDPSALESMELQFSVAQALGISLNDMDPDEVRRLMSPLGNGAGQSGLSVAEGMQQTVRQVNAILQRTVGADLATIIPFGLALLGIRSVMISHKGVMPAWHDYFWFSLSTYFMFNRPPVDR